MVHLNDPGLELAPPPVPELFHLIPCPYVLGPQRDPKAFRSFVAALSRTFNGFGCGEITSGDKPPLGRNKAYGYLLFPFEEDSSYATSYAGGCPSNLTLSSCGVTVRSLWMLLGARHALLNPPYKQKWVMTYLRAYAILCEAYRGVDAGVIQTGKAHGRIAPDEDKDADGKRIPVPKQSWDTFDPKPGDALFYEYSQHVSTIVEIVKEKAGDSFEVIACDGGQATDGDGPCCGISLIKRTIKKGSKPKLAGHEIFEDSSGKEVHGWADITKIKFVANFFTVYRNMGRLNLPDPRPIGA